MNFTTATTEQARLDELERHDIIDTPNEESFDRITRLVCRILQVPIATIAFLDGHRQWFKSKQRLASCEGDRSVAFCDLTIRQNNPLIVPDTHADDRFASNPFVTGPPYLRFYAGIPLRSCRGQNIGTLCAMGIQPRPIGPEEIAILSDLAGVVTDTLALRLLATTDGLTGALSRRGFRDKGARVLSLARRHGHDLSCILLDLDHFKLINDRHGHAAGDEVLAGSIKVCGALLRESDLIGRLGGEEFAVLLPHTGREAAVAVAEKLRRRIAAQVFDGADGPYAVTASFGIATADSTTGDLETLMSIADAALYRAKAEGRDRCIVSPCADVAVPDPGRRVLKAAQIVFNGGRSAINCTVRRLSERGAKLAVISAADVPNRFKLTIEADAFSKTRSVTYKASGEIHVVLA